MLSGKRPTEQWRVEPYRADYGHSTMEMGKSQTKVVCHAAPAKTRVQGEIAMRKQSPGKNAYRSRIVYFPFFAGSAPDGK